MAFCPNCGRKIEDESVGCPICNPKTESEKQPENSTNSKFERPVFADEQPNKPKKKGIGAIVGVVAVIAVVAILFATLLGGGGYKKAINNYIDFYYGGELDKISSLAPKSYWDYVEEEYDLKVKEVLEDKEEVFETIKEELEDYYGDKIKVSYKVLEEAKIDDDDLKEIKDHLKDSYDVPKKSVKEAYELEVEFTIKGNEDEDDSEIELIAVKIDGDWYLLSEYYSFVVPGLYY